MLIFKRMSEKYYYLLDSFNASNFNIKIDHFMFDTTTETIIVIYRIGRQKLLNKMNISIFEKEYFDKVSNYDQHRLTKFSTLQNILISIFENNMCDKGEYLAYLTQRIKSEQLF